MVNIRTVCITFHRIFTPEKRDDGDVKASIRYPMLSEDETGMRALFKGSKEPGAQLALEQSQPTGGMSTTSEPEDG